MVFLDSKRRVAITLRTFETGISVKAAALKEGVGALAEVDCMAAAKFDSKLGQLIGLIS